MKKQWIAKSILVFIAVGSMSACKPFDYAKGGLVVTMEANRYVLLNAAQTSCKSAASTSPTLDVTPLSMNLGRMSLAWTRPEGSTNATLKIVYINITMQSQGLGNTDVPTTVGGQDLNCIVHGLPDGGATLTIAQGGDPTVVDPATGKQVPHLFVSELLVGGFQAKDTTLKTSFVGTANVLVYALVHEPGKQDQPVIGRTTFQFEFGAIR